MIDIYMVLGIVFLLLGFLVLFLAVNELKCWKLSRGYEPEIVAEYFDGKFIDVYLR